MAASSQARPAIQIEIPAGPSAGIASVGLEAKDLHEAVATLNLNEVRKAVAALADKSGLLEVQDSLQRTPLVVAAKRGDASIVSYLLFLGANPDVQAQFGATPGGWAAHNAHFASDLKASFVGHPLSWAVRNNHFDVARILLSHRSTHEAFVAEGATVDVFGETIVHSCVRAGNTRMLKMILAFDTWDLRRKDASGKTPLDLADSPVVRKALDEALAPAAPRAAASLFDAIGEADFAAVCALLDRGADINAPNAAGETPLIALCKAGSGTAVAYFLFRGASVRAKDAFGYSALHWACINDHIETVRILLSHASVHAAFADPAFCVSVNGDTVLHLAVRTGHLELVRFVLAFETFLPALRQTNNQKQLPKDVADAPAVHDLCRQAQGALDGGMVDFPLLSPSLMTPMAQRFPLLCAQCLNPVESATRKAAYVCTCMATVCVRCVSDSVVASTRVGVFPKCVNAGCAEKLPLHYVTSFLPPDAQLSLVAVLVNEQFSIDQTHALKCRVCSRVNDIRPVLASGNPQFICQHCSVYLCAVCSNIFPPTVDDEDIHRECIHKMPLLGTFNEYNVVVTQASASVPQLDGAEVAAIAAVDARVSAKPETERAAVAQAIISVLRVRYALLAFVAQNQSKFCAMVSAFDLADSINASYFPLDPHTFAQTDPLPSWLSPEPEDVWALYGAPERAARWIGVRPSDMPDIEQMRRELLE